MKGPSGEDMIIMGSNNEGGIYDDFARTYGLTIKDGIPEIYELLRVEARSIYTQLFPIGVQSNGDIVLYDHETREYGAYKLNEYKK